MLEGTNCRKLKGKGDAKRKGEKYEPYAYIPLTRHRGQKVMVVFDVAKNCLIRSLNIICWFFFILDMKGYLYLESKQLLTQCCGL